MQRLGDGALRFVRPSGTSARALLELLRAWPRVTDAVVTTGHACIYFDPKEPPDDPTESVRALRSNASDGERRVVTVRARYDGQDLEDVSRRLGLTPEAVATLHAQASYTVAMIGFLPGFAYLTGGDPRLSIPRRAPRPRVPKGAIGIAAGYTGIYPFASPGGWNLIATTVDFEAFTPSVGALLSLGDQVCFERTA